MEPPDVSWGFDFGMLGMGWNCLNMFEYFVGSFFLNRGFMISGFLGFWFYNITNRWTWQNTWCFQGGYWKQFLSSFYWSSLTNSIHLRFQTSHWRPLLQRQPMRTRKPLMLLETLIWECRAWDVPLFWSAYWDLIEVPFSGPSVVLIL